MNFLQKFRDFISRPTHSRTMGVLIFFVLVAVTSLTVYVAQQQQNLRQRAQALEVCSAIASIPKCPHSDSCNSAGAKCKVDNIIFECKKQ